jgi:hypothetical protein
LLAHRFRTPSLRRRFRARCNDNVRTDMVSFVCDQVDRSHSVLGTTNHIYGWSLLQRSLLTLISDLDRMIDNVGIIDGVERTLSSIILLAKISR